jgi:hypothetical protein
MDDSVSTGVEQLLSLHRAARVDSMDSGVVQSLEKSLSSSDCDYTSCSESDFSSDEVDHPHPTSAPPKFESRQERRRKEREELKWKGKLCSV